MSDIRLMQELLQDAKLAAPKVKDWRIVEEREGWTLYAGTAEGWRMIVGMCPHGTHADGAGTKGSTVLHFTPELSLEVAKLAVKYVEENKN